MMTWIVVNLDSVPLQIIEDVPEGVSGFDLQVRLAEAGWQWDWETTIIIPFDEEKWTDEDVRYLRHEGPPAGIISYDHPEDIIYKG